MLCTTQLFYSLLCIQERRIFLQPFAYNSSSHLLIKSKHLRNAQCNLTLSCCFVLSNDLAFDLFLTPVATFLCPSFPASRTPPIPGRSHNRPQRPPETLIACTKGNYRRVGEVMSHFHVHCKQIISVTASVASSIDAPHNDCRRRSATQHSRDCSCDRASALFVPRRHHRRSVSAASL